eukprot:446677-Lingulodinium_polyedra.AAC.1
MGDCEKARLVPARGGRPSGVEGPILRFEAPPTEAETRRWRARARELLDALEPELPPLADGAFAAAAPDAAPVPEAVAQPAVRNSAKGPAQHWLVLEDGEALRRGQIAPPADERVVLGRRGLQRDGAAIVALELVPAGGEVACLERHPAPAAALATAADKVDDELTPRLSQDVTDARVLPV